VGCYEWYRKKEGTEYLVLPPALSDMGLSDEQLEQVAGG
jgi:hypothetical protein